MGEIVILDDTGFRVAQKWALDKSTEGQLHKEEGTGENHWKM